MPPGTPYVMPAGTQYGPAPMLYFTPAPTAAGNTTNAAASFGVVGLAVRLGFVAVVIGSATALVVAGYPIVAVIEVLIAAGIIAVELIRRLG